MSVLGDIESGVIALIEGIQDQGSPVFASVVGMAAADRKTAVAVVSRLSKPAALVVFEGHERYASARGVLGDPRLGVLVAATSLRSADGARLGDVDAVGAFDLSEQVTGVLEGVAISQSHRLVGIDASTVFADERVIVIEQRWVAQRLVSLTQPTYAGQAIAGSDSIVTVTAGKLGASAVEFAFPGIDGVYRHALGAGSRAIVWSGQLRAASHASLDVIEDGIEMLVGDPAVGTIADSLGRSYAGCVVESYERVGPRRTHPAGVGALQNFELTFVQVAG